MENYKFIGYIDNNVIANGFLIPLFQDISTQVIYTLKKISKNPEIDLSKSILLEKYKNDNIVMVSIDVNTIRISKPLDVIVYKIENKVYFNSYENSSKHLLEKIKNNEINSSVLCEYILKIFETENKSNSQRGTYIVTHNKQRRCSKHRNPSSAVHRIRSPKTGKYVSRVNKTKNLKKGKEKGTLQYRENQE